MPFETGTQLGPYQIVGPLGKGGMGEVYRADDSRLGRSVAIKVLPGDVSADRDRRVRFEREARAIAALNHPHICAIHDVGHQDGVDFLVMELLDGESLSDRLARGPLPFDEARGIALVIVETLGAVHERGLVHRDLKPANIFLTRHGVKLLDFGLARDVGPADDRRHPSDAAGTGRRHASLSGAGTGPRAGGGPSLGPVRGRRGHLRDARRAARPSTPRRWSTSCTRWRTRSRPRWPQAPRRGSSNTPCGWPWPRIRHSGRPRRRFSRRRCAQGSSTDTVAMAVPAPTPAKLTRLIVLPFRLLRPDAETDFLAFSLPDAVSAALSGLESVIVRSSLSAGPASPSGPDLPALARQVQVDAVVTGSLLRAGNELRLSAQLVAVPEGSLLWSHTIQAPIHDLFQLQDALTQAIVAALHVPLTGHDQRTLRQDVPASAEAYELFLRGNKMAADSSQWPEARDLYERAVALDPGYAPAWARLGRTLRVIAKFGSSGPSRHQEFVRAERAFERALALNPDLATAHYLYAHHEAETGRARDAMVRLLTRARSRQSDPELFAGLVTTCRYGGLLDESIAAYEQVCRLDPATRTSVAYTYYLRGNFSRAIETDNASMPFATTISRVRLGELDVARPLMDQLEHASPLEIVRLISGTYRRAIDGDVEALAPRMRQMIDSGFADPEGYFCLSAFVARAGALDLALDALERTVAGGYYCPSSLRQDPFWDTARSSERFERLLARAEAGAAQAREAFERAGGSSVLRPTA